MHQLLSQWMKRMAKRSEFQGCQSTTSTVSALFEGLESRQLMSAGGFSREALRSDDRGGEFHARPKNERGDRQVSYSISVIAKGLSRPTGIATTRDGGVYFTQVPTPGVGGGLNSVNKLNADGTISTLHQGEPEPTNITIAKDGSIYWTCKSAGVILEQMPDGTTKRLLGGLNKPSGIAIDSSGENVYFTEVPTPGVKGINGGTNTVKKLNIATGVITTLHTGDPEPTDIAVDRQGNVYWTCKSAGVIVEQTAAGVTSVVIGGLNSPTGIAIDKSGRNLYFTEVPTPGVKGSAGGTNTVNRLNLESAKRTIINSGDPDPQDIAVDRKGNVYWTCRTAGVVVEATRNRSWNDNSNDDD